MRVDKTCDRIGGFTHPLIHKVPIPIYVVQIEISVLA